MQCTEYIPIEKFQQFHRILCETGGRYVRNPLQLFETVEVCYVPGDYEKQAEAWARCNIQIRELYRNQWWRVLLRRCGIKYW